ncbi:MAG TPA: toll/interleukin-1 receptor domain-containing protein [Pyrinomonadaceae bacterium]|nr:toll/interleukin-1 receptor domain-containing protein [Pyrinomonadaceae bacterium]
MADQKHLDLINQGVDIWNASNRTLGWWRTDLSNADLSGRNLSKIDFFGAYLRGTNLDGADLQDANLVGADLSEASLRRVNFTHADLTNADISRANLKGANLTKANLIRAKAINASFGASLVETILCWANLTGADFQNAEFGATILGDTNLTNAGNLESAFHSLPSIIDHQTLAKSGPLPTAFLRGCGLPDSVIDFLPSLLAAPIEFYSCFISYSVRDGEFAQRLHRDLSRAGIRCWFAPQALRIGDSVTQKIDRAVVVYDKMLLILSESSIKSDWVKKEVELALEREREQHSQVLFPIRLDDNVLTTESAFLTQILGRHIGDFRDWTNQSFYRKALSRLIRDLTFSLTSETYK